MSVTMAYIDAVREQADVAKARMQVLRGHFAPGSDHDLCEQVGACSPDCGKTLSDFWKAEEECIAAERKLTEVLLPEWWAQGCKEPPSQVYALTVEQEDMMEMGCGGISDDGQCGIHPPGTPGCVNTVRPAK